MPDRDSIPLDYGRPSPKRLSFRWLILLAVWSVGLVVWLLYLLVLSYLLLVIL